jgi:hypothetical protein
MGNIYFCFLLLWAVSLISVQLIYPQQYTGIISDIHHIVKGIGCLVVHIHGLVLPFVSESKQTVDMNTHHIVSFSTSHWSNTWVNVTICMVSRSD